MAEPEASQRGRQPRGNCDDLRQAAEALILSRKGWEPWGDGHFLYDRLRGVGTGSVYTTADALRQITKTTVRR